jgi:hypothetical protein
LLIDANFFIVKYIRPCLAAEQARTRETCSPRQERRGGKPSCSA